MPRFAGSRGRSFSSSANPTPETPIEVLPKRRHRSGGGLITVELDMEELTVAIGAGSLADYVSQALLLHHSDAILSGRRPSGGPQAAMDPERTQGRRARSGERPQNRGDTGNPKGLPHTLTRSEIRSSGRSVRIGKGGQQGFTAHCEIYTPNPLIEKWLLQEDAAGHEFFAVSGEAERVVEAVLVDYLEKVFSGPRIYSKGKIQAGKL